jgi:hypothetical protein
MTTDVWHGTPAPGPDACYRCGYDLRTLGDEQPCPECGLLARRSRRVSDELRDTRPKWLARISRGANLILLAIAITAAWPFAWAWFLRNVPWHRWLAGKHHQAVLSYGHQVGPYVTAVLVLAGAWLLTSREGYPPADHADRKLRRWLRLAATLPLLAVVVISVPNDALYHRIPVQWWSTVYGVTILLWCLACAPVPLLLFAVLRGLAKRARSAHLAEHCTIVGIGGSASVIVVAASAFILESADSWGWGQWWTGRSNIALAMALVVAVATSLFTLWSLYLLVRFAIAFRRAARELRGQWMSDDRAVTVEGGAAIEESS